VDDLNFKEVKMKVRYKGPDIGVTGLTDGCIYEVIEIDDFTGALRIVDDSGEECGYLYNPKKPRAITGKYKGGKFEAVQDNVAKLLEKATTQ